MQIFNAIITFFNVDVLSKGHKRQLNVNYSDEDSTSRRKRMTFENITNPYLILINALELHLRITKDSKSFAYERFFCLFFIQFTQRLPNNMNSPYCS